MKSMKIACVALAVALAGCGAPSIRSVEYLYGEEGYDAGESHEFRRLRVVRDDWQTLEVDWDPEVRLVGAELVEGELALRWQAPRVPIPGTRTAPMHSQRVAPDARDVWRSPGTRVHLTAGGEALWDPNLIEAHVRAQQKPR